MKLQLENIPAIRCATIVAIVVMFSTFAIGTCTSIVVTLYSAVVLVGAYN